MIAKKILAPVEIENKVSSDLYGRIYSKWQQDAIIERQIREGILAKIKLELTNKEKIRFLENHRNRFVPKY